MKTAAATRSSAPLYLLPGMGADRRMFAGQRIEFPQLRVPDWLTPERDESLRDYAARMAVRIPPGPFVLGGVSFGGVVAQEISAIRRPQGLILISTLTSLSELRAPIRWMQHMPGVSRTIITRAAPPLCSLIGIAPISQRSITALLARMLVQSRPAFLDWGVREMLRWESPNLRGLPTLRLHGRHDRLIRPARAPGIRWMHAGHLLNMSHPQLVNREIRRFLARGDVATLAE